MTVLELQLDQGALAIRTARQRLRGWLQESRCQADCAATAELVASELLVNALQHAEAPVALQAELHDDCVHLEVHDDLPAPPSMRFPQGPRGAFGLHIVQAMSLDWGWQVTTSGKVVWADVEV